MKARSFDSRRLEVEAFARDAGQLSGEWGINELVRLRDMQATADDAVQGLQWRVRGERLQPRVGDAEVWLHLEVSTSLRLQCQRCLQPVEVPVHVDRAIRFVRGEDEAAALDADVENDVLALTGSLDLQELVEDEVLLALPLVPRHDECPQPLPSSAEETQEADDDEPHPFAALAALKAKPPGA